MKIDSHKSNFIDQTFGKNTNKQQKKVKKQPKKSS